VSKARLVITAVVVEKRSVSEVGAAYGLSRSWIYELVARYHTEGETAFEPRTRRPHTRPDATPASTVDLVIELRRQLTAAGLDAGADTISWHLEHHHHITVSRATIYRIARNAGLVTAEPKKKPKASYVRFQAEQPNETWQADFTHHRLADGTDAEILTWLDDHSRYALSVTAHQPVTGPTVVTTFRAATAAHGIPFSTLTDNGLVFTARFAHGGRTSRNGLENELVKLRVRQKNSRPNHPTTCGKVERFQQTMKKWLRTQPATSSIIELQAQLDAF
jgi:transposase InsO family protein